MERKAVRRKTLREIVKLWEDAGTKWRTILIAHEEHRFNDRHITELREKVIEPIAEAVRWLRGEPEYSRAWQEIELNELLDVASRARYLIHLFSRAKTAVALEIRGEHLTALGNGDLGKRLADIELATQTALGIVHARLEGLNPDEIAKLPRLNALQRKLRRGVIEPCRSAADLVGVQSGHEAALSRLTRRAEAAEALHMRLAFRRFDEIKL